LERVRQLRRQNQPWETIQQTLEAEARGKIGDAIDHVKQEERTAAGPHARPQPAGAGGMRKAPALAV
jgi:hypothetical protein